MRSAWGRAGLFAALVGASLLATCAGFQTVVSCGNSELKPDAFYSAYNEGRFPSGFEAQLTAQRAALGQAKSWSRGLCTPLDPWAERVAWHPRVLYEKGVSRDSLVLEKGYEGYGSFTVVGFRAGAMSR